MYDWRYLSLVEEQKYLEEKNLKQQFQITLLQKECDLSRKIISQWKKLFSSSQALSTPNQTRCSSGHLDCSIKHEIYTYVKEKELDDFWWDDSSEDFEFCCSSPVEFENLPSPFDVQEKIKPYDDNEAFVGNMCRAIENLKIIYGFPRQIRLVDGDVIDKDFECIWDNVEEFRTANEEFLRRYKPRIGPIGRTDI